MFYIILYYSIVYYIIVYYIILYDTILYYITISIHIYIYRCTHIFIVHLDLHWHPSCIVHVGHVVSLCAVPYAYGPTSRTQYEIVWGLSGQTTGWGLIGNFSTNQLPYHCSSDWHSSDCNMRHGPYNHNKHGGHIPT